MPEVVSSKSEFLKGSFQTLLIEPGKSPKRVLLCSGKIYWELKREIQEKALQDAFVLVRVEQLYPLDRPQLKALFEQTKEMEWVWVQEEPKNMGAWSHICLQLLEMQISIRYVGRPAAASPATGSFLKHEREQRQLIEESLKL
jgi:2-oxoglutarate dehydrogenase E1 component